jgi:uncharacterized protein (DUF697 family)
MMMPSPSDEQRATEIVAWYTLAAAVTGALPIPAASTAIVAETTAMIAHISSIFGVPISIKTIVASLGIASTLNLIGRTLFIEAARLLSWGTGGFWASLALSGIGATTAGLQTYIVGRLSIGIGSNFGKVLEPSRAREILGNAKQGYKEFVEHWKAKGVNKPESR